MISKENPITDQIIDNIIDMMHGLGGSYSIQDVIDELRTLRCRRQTKGRTWYLVLHTAMGVVSQVLPTEHDMYTVDGFSAVQAEISDIVGGPCVITFFTELEEGSDD